MRKNWIFPKLVELDPSDVVNLPEVLEGFILDVKFVCHSM